MSASSATNYNHWTYIDNDAFTADYPVDVAHAWFLRNNLAHLIDSCGQYRLNFMGTTAESGIGVTDSTSDPVYWAHEFPITMLGGNGLVGFDIRIAVAGSETGTKTVNARLVPARAVPVWDTGIEEFWTDSGTTTSTTGAWVIEDTKQGVTTKGWESGTKWPAITEGGVLGMSPTVMVRLEIKVSSADESEDTIYILGVQFREFPVWW